jgi:methanogenic corrinoid protein MtbC1
MEEQNHLSKLGQALVVLDEGCVEILVQKGLDQRIPPEQILNELSAGMAEVGERFRREEYFLTELIYSGEILKNTIARLKPLCKASAENDKGMVVMGTVQGDIHDLGKNIIITMLENAGFTVIDIGVDAPAHRFVEAVADSRARLIGMSMLLTTAFDAARDTVAAIIKANLRDKVKIMIGGSVTNENVRRDIRADFWGKDAAAAVDIAHEVYR